MPQSQVQSFKTQSKSFKAPVEHIFFKSVFSYVNMTKTEIQLRHIEKNISDLDSYIKVCTDKRKELEKIRRECVSWRLKHSGVIK